MINFDRGLCTGAAILAADGWDDHDPPPRAAEAQEPHAADPRADAAAGPAEAGSRSGLTAAAARGRFELQICRDCGAVAVSAAGGVLRCLSARLDWRAQDGAGELIVGHDAPS